MTSPFMRDGESLLDGDGCAREPIHIIGQAQSHGYLLAVSEPDFIVRALGTNVAELLATPVSDLLERPLEGVLGVEQFRTLRGRLAGGDLLAANPSTVFIGRPAVEMDCVAHRQDGLLLLELEPHAGAHSVGPLNVARNLQGPIARMERETDVNRLAHVAAAEIKLASGFDRVIVYRFDAEWNGRVIAEVGGGWPSFLGHHFPASDIPAQARRLFLINPLRAIVDVWSEPVPIVPVVNSGNGRPLDLSRSLLRSASPTHVQYVRNMGVRATMTVSIIVRGELWGMVTAHHSAAHRLDFTTRSICDLLGQILAAQIVARTDNAALHERLLSRERIEAYMSSIEHLASSSHGEAFDLERLLELLDADGVVSRIDGVVLRYGTTVDEARLLPLIGVLEKLSTRGIASSNMLSALEPEAAAYAGEASGALYLRLSESPDDYIVLLRRELVQTIVWAGNPYKPAAGDAAAKGALHPRTSFDAWQETVRARSRAWTELELENARLLREQFMQLREAQQRHKAEERVRYLAHFDVLTGLPNRSSIQDTLERTLARAIRDRSGLAVLFVDLDHFKAFNDRLGHAAGDRILEIVASRMQHGVRAEDTVGRLGGDEFIAILPGLETEQQTLKAASRLLTEIEKPLQLGSDDDVRITASIGISRFPFDGVSSELLLKHSDIAMYRAKEGGRNAAEMFSLP